MHKVPPNLERMDYTSYHGWYNTDHTIPTDYFRDDVERPGYVARNDLDFRYLFDDHVENPDFERMGTGVRIR